MLVMNASSQEQQVRVHGAWFSFKPKQIKDMHEDKVAFLISNGAYMGFVALPDELTDLEYRNSPEGQKQLKEIEEKGVANRIQHLEKLRQNELVYLQRDIDKAGLNYKAALEMSPGMLKNFEELAGYKTRKQDEAQKRLDRIEELEKKIAGN